MVLAISLYIQISIIILKTQPLRHHSIPQGEKKKDNHSNIPCSFLLIEYGAQHIYRQVSTNMACKLHKMWHYSDTKFVMPQTQEVQVEPNDKTQAWVDPTEYLLLMHSNHTQSKKKQVYPRLQDPYEKLFKRYSKQFTRLNSKLAHKCCFGHQCHCANLGNSKIIWVYQSHHDIFTEVEKQV